MKFSRGRRDENTGGPNKGEQEVEAEEGELQGRLGLGYEAEEPR